MGDWSSDVCSSDLLFEDKPAAEAVKELMLRDKKIEIDNSEWK